MKRLHMFPKLSSSKGQSLVEIALFFPIFIIMLAGLVEVANILVTQNRVTSAARASTRFAADGGENAGMSTVLLNTVTQTLQLNQDVWDVWAVRGTVNEEGTAILDESWEFTHIYGISLTEDASEVDEEAVRAQVLDELQRDEFGSNTQAGIAGDLEFVGTYAIHDIDSILGLNAVPQLVGFKSVKELAVMRVLGYGQEATDGCDGFPIAVYEGLRSVGPGSDPYPNNFDYPASPPAYADFFNHTPNVPLRQASEGDLFLIQNSGTSGNFGWLIWNEYVPDSAGNLSGSLTWPGNSKDYTSNAPGPTPPGFPHGVYGFIEYGDATDTTMHVGDWVAGNTGAVNSDGVRTVLNGHIDQGRTLRLIVWNQTAGTGNNTRYLISGYAIFRLHGYHLSNGGGGGNPTWILGEFIRWDDSCGQVPATGP